MSIASIDTRALLGIDSPVVTVEVHVSNGLPSLSLVGLPEASVKESKDRVRSALISSGFQLPPKRITVNLAPADLPKTGGRYDLPIALGILVATQQLPIETLDPFEAYGELGLNGEVRTIKGALSSVLETTNKRKKAILSVANRAEMNLLIETKPELNGTVFLVENLKQACQVLMGDVTATDFPKNPYALELPSYPNDFADVIGQEQAKRALEIAASGEHSVLMVGPPGSGKSMLASRLTSILPTLTGNEAIEVAKIQSIANTDADMTAFRERPFIQPHHSASSAAIIGGGAHPKPGALSLAHRGVLFLDELPEFQRNVLEALREPLETKSVHISRVNQHVTYPADNLLIAAMNPSPSGYFPDDPLGRCKDTPDQILRYQKRISGPLLDRIDLHLEVPAVEIKDLQNHTPSCQENSMDIRQRVIRTRGIQLKRQGCFNNALKSNKLNHYCPLNEPCTALLEKAAVNLGLSARSYHRMLRLARTIADMELSSHIEVKHLAEALSYRASSKALQ